VYWKDKAVLIGVEKTVDGNGYKAVSTVRREVLCNKKSATRTEFYTAKQAGEKIVLILEVRGADYRGETFAEHGGRLYEVVRDYTKSGEIYELNCKEAQEPPDGEGV
jgi:SPP1 family predicted phage head-tail adaptor